MSATDDDIHAGFRAFLASGPYPPATRARLALNAQRLLASAAGQLPDVDDPAGWRALAELGAEHNLPRGHADAAVNALRAYAQHRTDADTAAQATGRDDTGPGTPAHDRLDADEPQLPATLAELDACEHLDDDIKERIRAAVKREALHSPGLRPSRFRSIVLNTLVGEAQRAARPNAIFLPAMLHAPVSADWDRRDQPAFSGLYADVTATRWLRPSAMIALGAIAHLAKTQLDAARHAGDPPPTLVYFGGAQLTRLTTSHGRAGDSRHVRGMLEQLATTHVTIRHRTPPGGRQLPHVDEWDFDGTYLTLVEYLCNDGLWRTAPEIDAHPDGWQLRSNLGQAANTIRVELHPTLMAQLNPPGDRALATIRRTHNLVSLDALTWLPAGDAMVLIWLSWRAPVTVPARIFSGSGHHRILEATSGRNTVHVKAFEDHPRLYATLGFHDRDYKRVRRQLRISIERVAHANRQRWQAPGPWLQATDRRGKRLFFGVLHDPHSPAGAPSECTRRGTAPSRAAWKRGDRTRSPYAVAARRSVCRRCGLAGARARHATPSPIRRRVPAAVVASRDQPDEPAAAA